ncbi:tyramine beta-hydroxylase isoform X2 [Diorhabda sublineata]|uniref:tyramine beta-hydroxylase isoform X2 n=1 Tax=Diorhabda sublineata TaxID=1163346 RepID=UPI0024E10F72|nr:tyramine beta-hydroxylase isoform X2 [Diorhabda sublineata]
MWKNCGKTFIICVVFVSYIKNGNGNGIYHVSLRGDNSIKLYWSLDYNSETVIFEIHIPSDYGWFAIGFSDRGNLFPSDICLLWRDLKGISHLKDAYVDENGVTHNDKQEDCNNFKIKRNGNITKFAFERRFDTCDQQDYIIEEGTTHIVWSRGNHNLYKPEGINISFTPDNHGMVRVNLLKNTKVNYYLPSHVKIFDFLNDKVEVPAEETTYWCRIIKLPEEFKKKHHIYQYGANIQETSEGLVHHMEVFHCQTGVDEEIPLYNGDCFGKNRPPKTQVCKRVLAAWAMGAPPFKYPKEASLPIGGENFNPYIMLEVHYNNPDLRTGIIDSSGIRFHISSKLKEMDAGVIELGLEYTDKMAIPPGQDSFSLTGYCISSCTAMGHTLITKCDYNTKDRENITLGGFSISDEMCVNYIHYFPASELEVCKSSISDQALHTFFRYMNEWENQYTLPDNGISDNYKAIKWNRMRIQLLDEVYNESPISMQCNMSSGDRFPGYWENAPLPYLSTTLGPPPRYCDKKFK